MEVSGRPRNEWQLTRQQKSVKKGKMKKCKSGNLECCFLQVRVMKDMRLSVDLSALLAGGAGVDLQTYLYLI